MRRGLCLALLPIPLAVLPGCVTGPAGEATELAGADRQASPATAAGRLVAAGTQGGARPVEATHQKLELPEPDPLAQESLTPGVLMPRKTPQDVVVARVGGCPIQKSHVYDRLFEVDTLRTKGVVDTIAFDILLASQARKHKVFLDPTTIDKIVEEEVERLKAQVQQQWQGRMSIDDFLQIKRGRDLKTHRQFMRRQMARDLFRFYVVRYLALRENRVQVRILTHPDRKEVETIRRMVGEGADFESLALQKSRHPSQKAGGKLPPFTREDKSEFTQASFELKEGQVSEVRKTTQDGAPMYYLLYCLRHMPGRDIPFSQAKPELDKAWITSPLVRGEANALYLRLREASEVLNNGGQKR